MTTIVETRSGDPSHPGLPGGRWDPYDTSRRKTLLLGAGCALAVDPDAREREVWEGLL